MFVLLSPVGFLLCAWSCQQHTVDLSMDRIEQHLPLLLQRARRRSARHGGCNCHPEGTYVCMYIGLGWMRFVHADWLRGALMLSSNKPVVPDKREGCRARGGRGAANFLALAQASVHVWCTTSRQGDWVLHLRVWLYAFRFFILCHPKERDRNKEEFQRESEPVFRARNAFRLWQSFKSNTLDRYCI